MKESILNKDQLEKLNQTEKELNELETKLNDPDNSVYEEFSEKKENNTALHRGIYSRHKDRKQLGCQHRSERVNCIFTKSNK